jgi:hypothetical protein
MAGAVVRDQLMRIGGPGHQLAVQEYDCSQRRCLGVDQTNALQASVRQGFEIAPLRVGCVAILLLPDGTGGPQSSGLAVRRLVSGPIVGCKRAFRYRTD